MQLNDLFTDSFRYKLCNFITGLLTRTKEVICFKKKELEELNQRVDETKVNAKKFKRVEENIPNLFRIVEELKQINQTLESDNILMFDRLSKLYEADLNGNAALKKILFKDLGFDFNNTKIENKIK